MHCNIIETEVLQIWLRKTLEIYLFWLFLTNLLKYLIIVKCSWFCTASFLSSVL